VIGRFLLACLSALAALLMACAPALADSGLKSSGPLDFGAVDLHSGGTPSESVTVQNISLSEVQIGKVTISGGDAQNFSIAQENCSGRALEALTECSVEVEFKAQTKGTKSAVLNVITEAGELEVPLSGSGLTGTLTSSQSPLHFSPLPYAQPEHEGEANETDQLNVTDTEAWTQNGAVSIVGPDAGSFSIAYGDCEGDLMAAGNTCDEGIRFEPRSPGLKKATLLVESDASGGTFEVPLEGVALEGAQLTLSSHQALLGEVPLGGSAQNVFTLTDTGDYPLYIERAFLVSGTPLMFPILGDSCSGHALQPGSSCSMTIGFQPSATGEKSAGMILITNATPSIQVIGIDGIGVLPASVSPAVAPSPLQPENTVASPAVLTPVRPPHLESGATLHSGLLVHCPPSSGGCQVVSRITTAAAEAGVTLIGSSSTQLAAGAAGHAHIHLTSHATMLLNRRLKRQGRLTVTITTEVRAGATTLAARSRSLVLLAQL
jgi:hypothetical protein